MKVSAVSEELYKQAAASASAGAPGAAPEGAPGAQTPPPSGAKADDVVDADFEMVDKDDKKGSKK